MIELISDQAVGPDGRFADTPEQEEAPPMPLRIPSAGRSPAGITWWADIPGLDPVASTGDWSVDVTCAGMACAYHLYGEAAARAESWLPRKAAPAQRFVEWLLQAQSQPDATRRVLALRLVVDQPFITDVDRLLDWLEDLRASCTPRPR